MAKLKKEIKIEVVQVPSQVADVMRYAYKCKWFPFDLKKDVEFFLQIWLEFGDRIPLLNKFKDMETWLRDNVPDMGKNPRSRYRRFCEKHYHQNGGQSQPKQPVKANRKTASAETSSTSLTEKDYTEGID